MSGQDVLFEKKFEGNLRLALAEYFRVAENVSRGISTISYEDDQEIEKNIRVPD